MRGSPVTVFQRTPVSGMHTWHTTHIWQRKPVMIQRTIKLAHNAYNAFPSLARNARLTDDEHVMQHTPSMQRPRGMRRTYDCGANRHRRRRRRRRGKQHDGQH